MNAIHLPCPCCGEPNASIDIRLADGEFHCRDCETEFTAEHVRSLLARWALVMAWVDQMPTADQLDAADPAPATA